MKTIELDHLNRKTKCFNYGKIPEKSNAEVLHLAAPHIESFNYFLEEGLRAAVSSIPLVEFCIPNGDKISLVLRDVEIGRPQIDSPDETADLRLFPKECIEKGCSYTAPLTGTLVWMVNKSMKAPIACQMGDIPIMIKSKKCNLYGLSPKELIRHGELVNETGGYFIINGICRILRLLISNRRNYPIALIRKAWKMRDSNFTEKGILIRCVSEDQTSNINILHHLVTGLVKLEIQIEKEFFLIPLIMVLRALLDYSDRLIYQKLIRGSENDKYFSEKVKMMMRELQNKKLYDRDSCRKYIGDAFRTKLAAFCPVWIPSEEVCDFLFDKHLLIHLHGPKAKFDAICMMSRKLFAFIGGRCMAESVDVVGMQEATLGGHTYLQLIKHKLVEALLKIKLNIHFKAKEGGEAYTISAADMYQAAQRACRIDNFARSFLATGSLPNNASCGLMQRTGLTVTVDHLNRLRDLSHLRAIHRGSYFLDMKTIGPRRLTGEAWGFICPVHTPDGAPCGLLNHLAYHCIITSETHNSAPLNQALVDLGMTMVDSEPWMPYSQCLEVVVDGCLKGYITKKDAPEFALQLRTLKVKHEIYRYTEIVLVEENPNKGQYPGLFIITSVSRMLRPVVNLRLGLIEYVGTLEQLYLNIAVSPDDIDEEVHTHMDIEKTAMLSNVAKLVPFSDCNPNPRNMYQCQMGKQTMGTPVHNWQSQTCSKLYRLQSPQLPLVRCAHYDRIGMEEFCMGFNAVLAVVSYTGYDMEDAMVVSKGAMERGLGHGQVYKSEFIDLAAMEPRRKGRVLSEVTNIFKRDPGKMELAEFLDENGLPYPGTKLSAEDPYYCIYDVIRNIYKITKYRGEDCVVDKYSIMGSSAKSNQLQRVNITLRVRRDPIIGDKFASRSGQKGVMSRLYPTEDLPFSERGITPDIIFNPHGIPSRMTAGTLIDLVAGKCAAEFGKGFDATPFRFNDKNPAFDYYGKILEKAGFNYYGEDVLYSGTDGRKMEVEIFEGIVYYQRLRHMTADKWQVRSTGPIDKITHQPIKGRKRGGAIRFGEMERDCLIAHGAAYTLKDRLLDCSDKSTEWVCSKCMSVISTITVGSYGKHNYKPSECSVCGPEAPTRQIQMPYAFKFLVAELASVGIKTELGLKSAEEIMQQSEYPVINVERKSS